MNNEPSTWTYIFGLVFGCLGFLVFYIGTIGWPFTLFFLGILVVTAIAQALMQGAFEGVARLLRFLTTGRWTRPGPDASGATEDHGPEWPILAGIIVGSVSGLALGLMHRGGL